MTRAPRRRSSVGERPLTDPAVPTGMNNGVGTVIPPSLAGKGARGLGGKRSRPARASQAPPAWSSNCTVGAPRVTGHSDDAGDDVANHLGGDIRPPDRAPDPVQQYPADGRAGDLLVEC